VDGLEGVDETEEGGRRADRRAASRFRVGRLTMAMEPAKKEAAAMMRDSFIVNGWRLRRKDGSWNEEVEVLLEDWTTQVPVPEQAERKRLFSCSE
jgi:hypothetical protein